MSDDPGRVTFPYRRAFTIGKHRCLMTLRSGLRGNFSELAIDGQIVARDSTPPTSIEAARNHILQANLPDGRELSVEAGYISWLNIGIAVRVDGELVHESHPGRTIAMPDGAKKMLEKSGSAESYDPDVWKRNRIPLAVDIGIGLMFFVVAKLTDLTTAAIAGAVIGLVLYVVQRVTRIDLLGGLALFGIVMMLISAGLAIAFDSDDAVKYRTTFMGLLSATLFFADGLFGGKRLASRLALYLPYKDIDVRRLGIGMGLMGVVMAGMNQAVAMLASTDVWLFYTTFLDFVLAMVAIYFVFGWSRGQMLREAAPVYRAAER